MQYYLVLSLSVPDMVSSYFNEDLSYINHPLQNRTCLELFMQSIVHNMDTIITNVLPIDESCMMRLSHDDEVI